MNVIVHDPYSKSTDRRRTMTTMTEEQPLADETSREHRVRHGAKRHGLLILKSRRRGTWMLVCLA